MEKIKIEALDKSPTKRGDMLLVTYDGGKKASVAAWLTQDIDYMVKDVGIGGEVSVELTPSGDYTNITKIDMASAKKGKITESEKIVEAPKLMSQRDASIVGQVCLKEACAMIRGQENFNMATFEADLRLLIPTIAEGYKLAVSKLE